MRASNARPYDIDYGAGKTHYNGTGKPVPYRDCRTLVVRQCCGFVSSFDTGLTQYMYPRLRQIATKKP